MNACWNIPKQEEGSAPVFPHVLLTLLWDVVLILQLSLTRAAWGDARARSHCISFSWWWAGLLCSHTSLFLSDCR